MASPSFRHPKDEEFAHYTGTSQSDFEAALTRILFFIKDKTCADVDARQMERCLWLISVASKRQWSAEHRDALSVLHSDLVLGPVDAAAVFTQATYTRYASAPPRLDAAPARLPRNVSMLENPASIPPSRTCCISFGSRANSSSPGSS